MQNTSLLRIALSTLLLAGAGATLAAPGSPPPKAAAPPPAPVAVLSQTIRGVTVRLSNIHWQSIEPGKAPFAFYKIFTLRYDVQASPARTLPRGKSWLNYITRSAAISPEGYTVDASGGGTDLDPSGAIIRADVSWNDINPNWPLVAVDVDVLDPDAPARATGRSVAPITLPDIPLPSQPDVVAPVHVETITPLGTRVTVEKIKLSPAGDKPRTTIVFRVAPDPAAPDLQFLCSNGSKAVDDTGHNLGGGGLIGNADLLSGPPIHGNAGWWTTAVNGLPAPGAKTVRWTLDATESSAQMVQDKWYRHFHLLVPLRGMDTGAPRPVTPLAVASSDHVAATLDSVGWQWQRLRTRLVLRDRTDPAVTWRVTKLSGVDNNGSPLTGRTGNGGFFWKTDGSAVAPDENAVEMVMGGPGTDAGSYNVGPAPPDARSMTLTAEAEAVRERSHVLDFPRIPVPLPGQTLTLNRTVRDAFGDSVVLRSVRAYTPAHPLSPLPPDPYRIYTAPSGLVLVLAEPPAPARDDGSRPRFNYQVVAVNDPTGRHLRPLSSRDRREGDALSAAPAPGDTARVVTLFLRDPAPGARTFNLRLGRYEVTPVDKHETLTFPAVTLPERP